MHLNSYYLPGPQWQGKGTWANTALLIFLSSYVNVNSSWLKQFEYSDVNHKLQNTKIIDNNRLMVDLITAGMTRAKKSKYVIICHQVLVKE